jgi:hypothetical protein
MPIDMVMVRQIGVGAQAHETESHQSGQQGDNSPMATHNTTNYLDPHPREAYASRELSGSAIGPDFVGRVPEAVVRRVPELIDIT